MKNKIIAVALAAILAVPTYITARDSILGDECLVPIYHTDFDFPPQGGAIIDTPEGMYFVRTYAPGCENATRGYPIIRGSGSVAGNTYGSPSGGVSAGQPFAAPPTGAKRFCN